MSPHDTFAIGDRVAVKARIASDFHGERGTVVRTTLLGKPWVTVRLDDHANATMRGLHVFAKEDLRLTIAGALR
jgi:hypothetical protein